MNIKKELVKSFKNLLSAYFEKVYSSDELKISEVKVGGMVEVVNPDGTLSVAPDGDYVLDSGEAFTVKDGTIVSIVGQEEMETPAELSYDEKKDEEEETKVEATNEMAEHTDVEETPTIEEEDMKIVELQNKVAEMEMKLAELYSMVEGMKSQSEQSMTAVENFNSIVSELNTNIKTLAKIPVQFSKVDSTAKSVEDRQQKMMDLASILKK